MDLNGIQVNDNQEIDWETLTSTISTPSQCVPAGIWATNQVSGDGNIHSNIDVLAFR